jgi:hypothetical protein
MKCLVLFQVSIIASVIISSIVLYEYTNKEQELVTSCFRVGNFFTLRDLPNELGPNNIIQALREKLDKAKAFSEAN